MEKIKTYRLSISSVFPKAHSRAGEKTCFSAGIAAALKRKIPVDGKGNTLAIPKAHTIRKNYELWKKRIDEVNAGKAILVLYEWIGKPYRSEQRVFFVFDKDCGIGAQKLMNSGGVWLLGKPDVDKWNKVLNSDDLAKNDGLTWGDFTEWLKNYDTTEAMAIIHFTKFRY